jgi:hypothetical protein
MALRFLFLIVLFSLMVSPSSAQVPQWVWAQSYPSGHFDRSNAIATDNKGNVYWAMTFTGLHINVNNHFFTNYSSNYYSDILLIKYDTNGNIVWIKQIGNIYGDEVGSILTDTMGHIYISGISESPFLTYENDTIFKNNSLSVGIDFILKLDTAGSFIWSQTVRPSYMGGIPGAKMTFDQNGNLCFFESWGGSNLIVGTDTLNTPHDAFIVKFDTSGALIWHYFLGHQLNQISLRELVIDSSGNIYFTGAINNDPVQIGSITMYPLVSGFCMCNLYLFNLSPNGTAQWAFTPPALYGGNNLTLCLDAGGNCYLTCGWTGQNITIGNQTFSSGVNTSDEMIIKFTPGGNIVWANNIHGPYVKYINDSKVKGKNLYLSGVLDGPLFIIANDTLHSSNFDTHTFLLKADTSGTYHWIKHALNMSGVGSGSYLSLDQNNNIFYTGDYRSNIQLDQIPIGSGGDCTFISKIDQSVFPPLVISGSIDSSICNGSCVPVSAFATGGTSLLNYTWTPDIGSGPGPFSVCPSSSTTYFVSAIDTANNSVTDSIAITVNNLPSLITSFPDTINPGDSISLSVAGATMYSWQPCSYLDTCFGDSVIAFPSQTTTYYVTGTDLTGCESLDSILITVDNTSQGIDHAEPSEFYAIAYPNPFIDGFSLKVFSSAIEKVSSTMHDVAGREVESHDNVNETTLIGLDLKSGIYFLKIHQGKNIFRLRVRKQY